MVLSQSYGTLALKDQGANACENGPSHHIAKSREVNVYKSRMDGVCFREL